MTLAANSHQHRDPWLLLVWSERARPAGPGSLALARRLLSDSRLRLPLLLVSSASQATVGQEPGLAGSCQAH
eukprot:158827-Rhodomonas_salina.5